jgi:RNA polymerase sigma-70 factor (ECF subfamily)
MAQDRAEYSQRSLGPASALNPAHLAALVQAIGQRGDRDAFRRLFVALAPAVKSLALRQGADAQTAEELVQDTFLAVWRKARLFSAERGAVTTWIFAIARNRRIDRLRQATPWQELTDEHENEPSDEPAADDALAARQIQMRVGAVLNLLPVDQAAVVRLAYLDGLSQSEIAERLGAPLGTVKTRMNLAYGKLRAALQDYR